MKYSGEEIAQVRQLPITDVAEKLGMTVVMDRHEAVTNCVWHDDINPSLMLGSAKKRALAHRCWCRSCGHGGDVIHLTQGVRKCSWLEAVDWLVETFPNQLLGIANRQKEGKEEPQVHIDTAPHNYPSAGCVRQFVTMDNALSQCLLHLFPRETVARVTWDYLLGSDMELSWGCAHTLFPSIDHQGRLHQVKLQCYDTDPKSPRFCHHIHDHNLCVGNRVAPPGEWTFDLQCLFGEHLLNRYPDKQVMLVESPKNAVVGACHDPSRLWLATGSKGMFNRQMLTPLLGRQVLVIPDRDAVRPWSQTLGALREFHTMVMSDFHTRHADWGDDHCDIADYIIAAAMK